MVRAWYMGRDEGSGDGIWEIYLGMVNGKRGERGQGTVYGKIQGKGGIRGWYMGRYEGRGIYYPLIPDPPLISSHIPSPDPLALSPLIPPHLPSPDPSLLFYELIYTIP